MPAQVKPNQFLVDKHGRPQAVVLSLVTYQKLLRLIEDATDANALKHAISTRRSTISHGTLVTRLKQQHLI